MKAPKPDKGGDGSGHQTLISGAPVVADADVKRKIFDDSLIDDDVIPGLADSDDDNVPSALKGSYKRFP
jgi:hypothetical protein